MILIFFISENHPNNHSIVIDIMLIIIEATNDVKNESIIIPFTIYETKYNNIALMMNVNKPNVSKFIGKVISKRTGLIKTFRTPNSAEAIIIDVAVSAEKPFNSADAR
ncbi:MAG: hypothetical protein QHH74_06990 [Spirochaetota bacterium]|nr:hypothetical protein [Spirochaetota bacterium]